MFIAALKVAGGAPKVEKLYLHANALLGPAFCVGFTGEDVALPALIKLNMQGTGLKDGGAAAIAAAAVCHSRACGRWCRATAWVPPLRATPTTTATAARARTAMGGGSRRSITATKTGAPTSGFLY